MQNSPLKVSSRALVLGGILFQISTGQSVVNLPASLADAGVQVVGVMNKHPETGSYLAYCEGPAVDAQGNIFFDEQVQSFRIWKSTAQGQGSLFNTGNSSNGIEFDPQGKMIVGQRSLVFSRMGFSLLRQESLPL